MKPNNYDELFPDMRDSLSNNLKQAQIVMLRILKVIDHICKKHNIEYWLDGGTLLGAVRHKGFIPWDDDIDLGMMRDDYNKFIKISKQELPEDMFLQTRESDSYYNITVPLKIRDTKSLFVEEFETIEENYNQGIYVDIFSYDFLPKNAIKRKLLKRTIKKISKIIRAKLTPNKTYTNDLLYKTLKYFFSLKMLQKLVDNAIVKTNKNNHEIIGFGLDSSLTRNYIAKEFYPLIRLEFEGCKFLAPNNYDYYLKTTYGDYMKLPPKDKQKPKHSIALIPNIKRKI